MPLTPLPHTALSSALPHVPVPSPTATAAERRGCADAGLRAMSAERLHVDPRLADGWYSDRYFVRAASTLALAARAPFVRMQVFAKQDGILAGVYEVLRLLENQGVGHAAIRGLRVDTLLDGDVIAPWESVMHILAPYRSFAHLETVYLGILARRTLVASNVRRMIEATPKPVLFMGARHDDYRVQTADGYAAQIGGAGGVSSDAGTAWWGGESLGTMPHALIAAFGGDVVAATLAFTRYLDASEPHVQVISLVDYQNDVVRDAVAVAMAMAQAFGPGRLAGVRIDTSEKLEDVCMAGVSDDVLLPGERRTGVNSYVVTCVRRALDRAGFPDVHILVSGGFTPAKLRRFEAGHVPYDGVGVGSSVLGHNGGVADGLVSNFDFTADIVEVDGRAESKIGRGRRDNPRFVSFDLAHLPSSVR